MLKLMQRIRELAFSRKAVSRRNRHPWALDTPLLTFAGNDEWTIGDATQGAIIFGATGSGKTTGSGEALAKSFLNAGFGGLVLTAKPGESGTWWRYCEETNRLADLVVVDAISGDVFNFLDYERTREGLGAGFTENIVALINNVQEVSKRNQSNGNRGEDPFWRTSQDQLTRNSVDLLILAGEEVSIPNLHKLVSSAPNSPATTRSNDWQRSSYLYHCFEKADRRLEGATKSGDFDLVFTFWMKSFPELAEKTRSIIVSSFTATIDILNRGLARKLFTGKTNLTPDAALEGKIILIDLPVKEFFEVGQVVQVIWKTQFQRCVERRKVTEFSRPVFLWADEAHNFVTSGDMNFQTTARSSRACTVYLTQNYSNLLAALGGEEGRAAVDSLLGSMQTKIFHANGDSVTNSWAAESVGRVRQFFTNFSEHYEPIDFFEMLVPFARKPPSTTNGISETMEYLLPPSTFPALACGGPRENWEVTGVLFQGGRVFRATGRPFLFVSFHQQH
jgi:hypothetical protein